MMSSIRSCSAPTHSSEAPGCQPNSDLAHALAAFPQQTQEPYDTERIRVRALLTTLSQRPDHDALLQAASRVCLPAWSEAERSALLRACAELPPGVGEALRDALPRIPDRLDTDDMIAVVRALKPPEAMRPFFILAQAFGYNPGCQDHSLERAMAALARRGDVITYERARIAATVGLCTSKRSVDYETRSLQRQLCELSRARSASFEAAAVANPGTPQGLPITSLRRLQKLMREHQGPALRAHDQGIRFLRQVRIALR